MIKHTLYFGNPAYPVNEPTLNRLFVCLRQKSIPRIEPLQFTVKII